VSNLDDLKVYHAYLRLVEDCAARPLRCGQGHNVAVTWRDEDVSLWCPTCDTYTTPGIKERAGLRALVVAMNVGRDNG
jgi:hypothetical protein